MKQLFVALGLLIVASTPTAARAGFIFAGEANGVDVVTHPIGYFGSGAVLNLTVGIDSTSANAAAMQISTQNVVNTFNALQATTGNLDFSQLAGSQVDFESVLLHELGHSLGLAHVNAATESGLTGANQNYTKATDGANNTFDLNAGADGVIGSSDDIRGDDINLKYFKKADNDPFTLPASDIIDSTTYSRDLADLPVGHNFAANGDRNVGALLGYTNTESAMQQGTFGGETQRTLTAEDVAHLRYGMSGLDELQGTSDDYTFVLNYVGLVANADILIDFDNTETGFAVSKSQGAFIGGTDHVRITSTAIFFNTGFNWFFNDSSNVPEPSSFALILCGVGFGVQRHRRRRKRQANADA